MASLHHLTEDTAPNLQQAAGPRQTVASQNSNPYNNSRFFPFRQPQTHHGNNNPPTQAFPSQPPTAPPPGFQNTIRPPPQLATGMLDSSHKQLMDAFQ